MASESATKEVGSHDRNFDFRERERERERFAKCSRERVDYKVGYNNL